MLRKTTGDALRAAARGRTGLLTVVDRRTRATARLFVLEGEPYAIALDGYEPEVVARLHAAGAIDADQRSALAHDPQGGRHAVERGWASVDSLADVHTELLVASLGAVLQRDRVSVTVTEGRTTDAHCALPTPLDALIELAALRRERTAATWRAVTADGSPQDTGLTVTVREAVGDAPELAAFLSACTPGASVDEAAARTGLTRAEAVHLAALAVLQHRAVAVPIASVMPTASGPQHALAVPEQFGEVVLAPRPPVVDEDLPALQAQVARLERELAAARERLAAASALAG